LTHTAADHLPDFGGVDLVSRKQALQYLAEEFGGMEATQAAISATDGRTDSIDDYNIRHGGILGRSQVGR
jgi:hypothetical protein